MKKHIMGHFCGVAVLCAALLLTCFSFAEDIAICPTEELSPAMQIWKKIDNDEMEIQTVQPELIWSSKSLSEIEEHTQYIVKGTFRGDSEEDIQKYPSGYIVYGCTITSFDISSVIQGEDLQVGDVIRVAEEFYVDHDSVLQTMSNCMPAETGKEYILFLRKRTSPESRFYGMYSSADLEKGRYAANPPESVDLASNRVLTLGPEDASTYKMIYKEVIEKYLS